MSPLISVFCQAIYTDYWQETYDTLSKSKVDFEIVYAGHVAPSYILPSNFKFIFTHSAPAASAHIAFSQTSGKYVIFSPDDLVYENDFLHEMLHTMQSHDDTKTIVSCYYGESEKIYLRAIEKGNARYIEVPPHGFGALPIIAMMNRNLFMDLGGIDKRFLLGRFDLDIAMRLFSAGGNVVGSPTWVYERPRCHGVTRLKRRKGNANDKKLFNYLWPNMVFGGLCDLNRVKKNGRSDAVRSY